MLETNCQWWSWRWWTAPGSAPYTSSGLHDDPQLGKNPRGTWTLEIHNDAYSNCGSEAKFFKWSLKLYGTEMDENSEDLRVGVRHGPIEMEPTTEATTTRRRTTTEKLVRLREKEGVADINCTKTREECRTFKWRPVAKVFCKCTPGLCLEVPSQGRNRVQPSVHHGQEDEYKIQRILANHGPPPRRLKCLRRTPGMLSQH